MNVTKIKKSRLKRRVIRILVFSLVIILILQFVFPYQFKTSSPSVWYDRNWNVVIGHKQLQYNTLDEVPQDLQELIVGIEDRRFWSHPGIDPQSLLRAVTVNIRNKGIVQWASTIDQQLIKLDHKQMTRSRWAKRRENRRAFNLQFHLTKKDILLRYINIMPFSHSIVGWKSACQSYRWKPCDYLTKGEMIVTLVISQLGANPYREDDWDKIMKKAKGYAQSRTDLFISPLELSDELGEWLQSFPAPLDPRVSSFIRDTTASGKTSFDLELSRHVDEIIHNTKVQRDQYNIRDCCIVVLDEKGEIITMNMCSDRNDPEAGRVNSCLVPRQTGSAIKPFLYLFAFKKLWLGPYDTIVDESVQFDLWWWNIYDPKNFDLTYHGEVSYAYALGNSLNVPAIKTLYTVGVEPFLIFLQQQLKRLAPGWPKNPKTAADLWLSLALGTYELSPRQFTQLWRMFLPTHSPWGYEWETHSIVEVLSDPSNKIVSFGQDNFLSPQGRAVKTGTSRNFVDGRICGTNREKKLNACIWLGNYNNESMLGASSEVWSYMRSLLANTLAKDL